MHIPDGLMAPAISAVGWLIAVIFLAISLKLLNKKLEDRQVTLMAVLAAAIFVAQMLNFPIGGGTTGHLLGAAMASIILGPIAGMLILTVILIIQGLVFGDGGLTALGLNIFNMAIIGCLVGWYTYWIFPKKYKVAGMFAAAWLSVFAAAFACTVELALSFSISGGAYGISGTIAFPAMLTSHAIIAIGESIITAGVVAYLAKVSPGMLKLPKITFFNLKKEAAADA
jgi:cobalt/nickel transport system permease protein